VIVPQHDKAGFARTRYTPGIRNRGSVVGARVYLSRYDTRTIDHTIITLKDMSGLGYLGNCAAAFLCALMQQGAIASITLKSWHGQMVVMLRLPDDEANPGLALLNRINAENRKEVLRAVDLIAQAGLDWQKPVYPEDPTPDGCRLVDMLESHLLHAINDALVAKEHDDAMEHDATVTLP
jgi:hypothetical protein